MQEVIPPRLSARADAAPSPVPDSAATATDRPTSATLTLHSSETGSSALPGSAVMPTAGALTADPSLSVGGAVPPTYHNV